MLSSFVDELDDSKLYFEPAKNNVIFSSAIGGWGFTIQDWVSTIQQQVKGINDRALKSLIKRIFGDYYVSKKTKKVEKHAMAKKKEPIFATFILKPIEMAIKTICVDQDLEKFEKMLATINSLIELDNSKLPVAQKKAVIKIAKTETKRIHQDSFQLLKLFMSQWMPLAETCLKAVVDLLGGRFLGEYFLGSYFFFEMIGKKDKRANYSFLFSYIYKCMYKKVMYFYNFWLLEIQIFS